MNIILKAAAALLAVTLAASCVFEKEEPSQTQQKYKYVLVQLGVNTDKMIATKAQGDTIRLADSVGIAAETAIKDLKVYAYTLDASNNKVLRGYLSTQNVNAAATATKPLLMDIKVPFEENGAQVLRGYFHAQNVNAAATATKPLLMDIKVPFEEYGKPKQVYFMAVANAGGMTVPGGLIINSIGRDPQTGALILPDSFGFDDFAGIRYSVADQTFAKGMPMYCQTTTAVTVDLSAEGTPNTEPGHNGHTKLPVKVSLDMTRSLAKIEVYAAEDAGAGTSGASNAGIQITGVELINVIKDGPLFPAAASTDTLTTNPTLNGKAVALSASAAEKADPDKYTKITDAYYLAENAAGETSTFYYGDDLAAIATTDNLKAATTLKIGYKVGTNGDQKYGYVIMPQIKRNTWYKVLARIKANGQMALTLKVLPWNDTEEQVIDFADNVSLQGAITWTGGSYNETTSTVTLGSSKGSSSTCTFTMDAPKGGYWYVTLAKGDISNFTLKSESETTGKTTLSGAIVPGQQIKFIVETLEGNYLAGTKTADLHITARTADGRTLVVRHGSGKDAFYKIVQSQN